MKDIREILLDLAQYYRATRGVGHTRTLVHGIANSEEPVIIMSGTEVHAKDIANQSGNPKSGYGYHEWASYADTNKLLGVRSPLAIDHWAIMELIGEILPELK